MNNNLRIILSELDTVLSGIDEEKNRILVADILQAEQVFVVGVGRVLLMLQAFVKRLNHLGIRAWYVGAINEPAITSRDLLIVGSGSGESLFPVAIAKKARNFGPKIVHIGSNARNSITPVCDLFIRIPCRTKLNLPDEVPSRQVMSSLFEQSLLLYCDGLAMEIARQKKIEDMKTLWRVHANLE